MKIKRKSDWIRYKSIEDFGKAMGLSDFDMRLMDQKREIINKLKAERLKQKLTQAQMARKVGSTQPAIARMECGMCFEVSLDFLARIAFALGMTFKLKSVA